MKFFQTIRDRWRDFFRKRRFTMLNATDNSEEWHIHLSPASVLAGFVSFVLLLFVLLLSLIAYTPVLEFLPGYRTQAGRSRENIIQNIIRIDSMERVLTDMMTYNENISMILDGKMPVVRTFISSDSLRTSKILVKPSAADSALRIQMEGDGPYSLAGGGGITPQSPRRAIELVTPIDGIVTDHYDIKEGRFGVKVAAAAGDPVTAIDEGTVVISRWTPETGHIIEIQHTNSLLSIYRHLSQSLVTKGQRIRSGEVIGYNSEVVNGEVELFEFELWNNGKPVDPEGYILF